MKAGGSDGFEILFRIALEIVFLTCFCSWKAYFHTLEIDVHEGHVPCLQHAVLRLKQGVKDGARRSWVCDGLRGLHARIPQSIGLCKSC